MVKKAMAPAHKKRSISLTFFILLLSAASLYFVMSLYGTYRNTAERATEQFAQALAKGDQQEAYKRLTPALVESRGEQYWQHYLGLFAQQSGVPKKIQYEPIADTFSVYPPGSEPERFVYTYALDGRAYRLTIVSIKQEGVWRVDELYGSYFE